MEDPKPTFLTRLTTAAKWTWRGVVRLSIGLLTFWRALADPEYARAFNRGAKHARQAQAVPLAPAATLDEASPDGALLLLGLLQKEGRLVDFLEQDVARYSDQEMGAAARVVHQGCRRVLDQYLTIRPVRPEPEGTQVTLKPGFDPTAVRPTGQVVGEPPFSGALIHRGWRATDVRLPQVPSGRDLSILAAAEVEL